MAKVILLSTPSSPRSDEMKERALELMAALGMVHLSEQECQCPECQTEKVADPLEPMREIANNLAHAKRNPAAMAMAIESALYSIEKNYGVAADDA